MLRSAIYDQMEFILLKLCTAQSISGVVHIHSPAVWGLSIPPEFNFFCGYYSRILTRENVGKWGKNRIAPACFVMKLKLHTTCRLIVQ
jgi:hypothetical protein